MNHRSATPPLLSSSLLLLAVAILAQGALAARDDRAKPMSAEERAFLERSFADLASVTWPHSPFDLTSEECRHFECGTTLDDSGKHALVCMRAAWKGDPALLYGYSAFHPDRDAGEFRFAKTNMDKHEALLLLYCLDREVRDDFLAHRTLRAEQQQQQQGDAWWASPSPDADCIRKALPLVLALLAQPFLVLVLPLLACIVPLLLCACALDRLCPISDPGGKKKKKKKICYRLPTHLE